MPVLADLEGLTAMIAKAVYVSGRVPRALHAIFNAIGTLAALAIVLSLFVMLIIVATNGSAAGTAFYITARVFAGAWVVAVACVLISVTTHRGSANV